MLKLKRDLNSRYIFDSFLLVLILVAWYLSSHLRGNEEHIIDLIDESLEQVECISIMGKNNFESYVSVEYNPENFQFLEIIKLIEQMSVKKMASSETFSEEINYNAISLNFKKSYICLMFVNENTVYITGLGTNISGNYVITNGPGFSSFSDYYIDIKLK